MNGESLGVKDHQPLIQLTNLSKHYRADLVETLALRNIAFSVSQGEFVSICGTSGCGKSTLLMILGLLDTPTSGEYRLNGQPTHGLSRTELARLRNRQIGFVFQSFNLIGDLTVLENVTLPLTYRTEMSRAARSEAARRALERVGMSHRMDHYPSQLSGGQQQRVSVARALAGKPSLLLVDEPTGNLDSKNGQAVMDLLGELHREGATILMVTHDRAHADLASRTVQLRDGQFVECLH